jgi:hypothetical protein
MSAKVLETIEQSVRIANGDRYVSDLGDIDVGMGNHLIKVIHSLKESNVKRYANFFAFTQRAQNEKLYYSTEVEPKRFIRQLRQRFFSKDGAENKKNKGALPLIYFHRAAGMDQSISGEESITKNMATIVSDSGVTIAEVDELPTTATYMLYVLAWDQATLDKLVAGIVAGLNTSSRKLSYFSAILGVSGEPEATISPTHSSSWSDMSPVNEDDRLLVCQLPIEVKAGFYQARGVTEAVHRFQVLEPSPMYGVNNVG